MLSPIIRFRHGVVSSNDISQEGARLPSAGLFFMVGNAFQRVLPRATDPSRVFSDLGGHELALATSLPLQLTAATTAAAAAAASAGAAAAGAAAREAEAATAAAGAAVAAAFRRAQGTHTFFLGERRGRLMETDTLILIFQ